MRSTRMPNMPTTGDAMTDTITLRELLVRTAVCLPEMNNAHLDPSTEARLHVIVDSEFVATIAIKLEPRHD